MKSFCHEAINKSIVSSSGSVSWYQSKRPAQRTNYTNTNHFKNVSYLTKHQSTIRVSCFQCSHTTINKFIVSFWLPLSVSILETSPIQQIRFTIRPVRIKTEICHTTTQQSIVLPQLSNPLGIGYMIWHTTIKLPASSNR